MQKGRLKDIGKSNGKRKLIYKSSYGQRSDCEKYKSTGRRVMAFAGIFLIGFIIIGRNCVKWILCDIIVIAAAILTIMIMLIIH